MEQQSESNGGKPVDKVNQKGILQDTQHQTDTDKDMWDEYIAWCISQEKNTHE